MKTLTQSEVVTAVVTGFVPVAPLTKKPLSGAAAKSAARKEANVLIARYLPMVEGESVKQGGRSRPVKTTLEGYANNYLRDLPAKLVEAIQQKPVLFAAIVDALCEARREQTENEWFIVANGYDINAGLGSLNGEPQQQDLHGSFAIGARENESLGDAFLRQYRMFAVFAQGLANAHRKPIAIVFLRYALDRNCRDAATAAKFGYPATLVGLMSRNNAQVLITDQVTKNFEGQIGKVEVFLPQSTAKVSTEPRKVRRAA